LKTGIEVPGAERRRERIDIDQEWGPSRSRFNWREYLGRLGGIPR
jgi:hypothetical protein